jgi:hypothetical protein
MNVMIQKGDEKKKRVEDFQSQTNAAGKMSSTWGSHHTLHPYSFISTERDMDISSSWLPTNYKMFMTICTKSTNT